MRSPEPITILPGASSMEPLAIISNNCGSTVPKDAGGTPGGPGQLSVRILIQLPGILPGCRHIGVEVLGADGADDEVHAGKPIAAELRRLAVIFPGLACRLSW